MAVLPTEIKDVSFLVQSLNAATATTESPLHQVCSLMWELGTYPNGAVPCVTTAPAVCLRSTGIPQSMWAEYMFLTTLPPGITASTMEVWPAADKKKLLLIHSKS